METDAEADVGVDGKADAEADVEGSISSPPSTSRYMGVYGLRTRCWGGAGATTTSKSQQLPPKAPPKSEPKIDPNQKNKYVCVVFNCCFIVAEVENAFE